MMLKYEVNKIFLKKGSWVALLLLVFLLGIISFTAIHEVYFVNDKGEEEHGYGAIQKIKEAKKQWRGELTIEKLEKVVAENNRINNSKEWNSENITENNIAFGWKQGFDDILGLIKISFGKLDKYGYSLPDRVEKKDVKHFYENRIKNLKVWIGENPKKFSEKENEFMMHQYEHMNIPLYYDYADGWVCVIGKASSMIMLMVLILGFLIAGIFSEEFRLKADAIFYASYYGRSKAVKNKIVAGILVVTIIYWLIMLLYSVTILAFFGIDGMNSFIQTSFFGWRSLYNLTYLQVYGVTLVGGYVGTLFIMVFTMYVSATTRSTVLAVIVSFVLIFIPSFLDSVYGLEKVLGLLPDKLLLMYEEIRMLNLYQLGGKVMPSTSILFPLYVCLSVVLCPILYQTYRRAQIK